MLKKAANQGAIKEYEKLNERLKANVEDLEKLMKSASMPSYSAMPDHDVFKNLLGECEDSDFWQNFKKAAPIIFCKAIEEDATLK